MYRFQIVVSYSFDFIACFVTLSAISLPAMSLWPGIHLISVRMFLVLTSESIVLIAEMRTPYTDCLLGLKIPVRYVSPAEAEEAIYRLYRLQ